ncbi:hypothetical protein BgiBS90_032514 [Biomphalaria glabrata]|nr:hypothetical protein BgiBS90_032514 [Biomphalaria glabrata]
MRVRCYCDTDFMYPCVSQQWIKLTHIILTSAPGARFSSTHQQRATRLAQAPNAMVIAGNDPNQSSHCGQQLVPTFPPCFHVLRSIFSIELTLLTLSVDCTDLSITT